MRNLKPKRFRLIAFDLDGTLTKIDSIWRLLHDRLGTWSRAKVYADMFYRGEINYAAWARLDAALWKGIPFKQVEGIVSEIEYADGAYEVVERLRAMGLKVGVISAGLSVVADRALRELRLDFAEANRLTVKNGVLTGEIVVEVSHGEKDRVLDKVRARFSVSRGECIAVGDDVTNISLFKAVGLSIAFNPTTSEVAESAHVVVKGDLRRVVSVVEKAMAEPRREPL